MQGELRGVGETRDGDRRGAWLEIEWGLRWVDKRTARFSCMNSTTCSKGHTPPGGGLVTPAAVSDTAASVVATRSIFASGESGRALVTSRSVVVQVCQLHTRAEARRCCLPARASRMRMTHE